MTYEEKRELRLQISQLLADAGLNQKAIKDMVKTEIKNKVDRAIEQCIKRLDAECSSNDYIKDSIDKYINSVLTGYYIKNEVGEALKKQSHPSCFKRL